MFPLGYQVVVCLLNIVGVINDKDKFSTALIFLTYIQSNTINMALTMNLGKKKSDASDKTGDEPGKSNFPVSMIIFILMLSVLLMILILFKV